MGGRFPGLQGAKEHVGTPTPPRCAGMLPPSRRAPLTCLACQVGVEIIQRAIRRPAKTIANNAGLEGDVIVGKLLEMVRSTAGTWQLVAGAHAACAVPGCRAAGC